MGVLDGQPVNQAVTNPAFINKNIDDSTPSKLGLANGDPISGSNITNTQRELNSHASFMGSAVNQAKDQLPSWVNNNVGTPADTLKDRAEALTLAFASTALARVGTSAISASQTNLVVTFSSPLPSTSYSVTCTLVNTTDAFGQHQPILVTAKSTSGFTAEWDQSTDSANYLLGYIALMNV